MLASTFTHGNPINKKDKWFRPIVLGLVVVGLLVALAGTMGQKESVAGVAKKNMLSALTLKDPHADCLEWLTKSLGKANVKDASFWHEFRASADAEIGYVDSADESHVVPFSTSSCDSVLASASTSRNAVLKNLRREHKFVDTDFSNRAFLYGNNMVVTADLNTCRVKGLYLPTKSGRVHPKVYEDVGSRIHTAQDKDTPCRTSYGRCHKDGALCAVKAIENCGRVSCSKRVPCPSGWGTYGGYFACEGTSCTSECGTLNCGSVGSYGHCTVTTTNCDFSHLDQKIADTSTTVGNVVTAVQTGLSLASLIPSPGDTIIGFLSSAIGFAGNAGKTAEQAYNELMVELKNTVAQVKTCVDEKIMTTNAVDLLTGIASIKSDLGIAAFKSTPAADQRKIFSDNRIRCTDIGSRFSAIVASNQPLVKVDGLFAYAMDGSEVCVLNYLAQMIDKKQNGQSINTIQHQYRVMATNIFEAVKKMITWLEQYHGVATQCGFYNSDKTKLRNFISKMRSQYQAPLEKLKNAITAAAVVLDPVFDARDAASVACAAEARSSKRVSESVKSDVGYYMSESGCKKVLSQSDAVMHKVTVVILGDDSVAKIKQQRVVNGEEFGDSMVVPNDMSCLALVRMNANYVAADVISQDDNSVLCRLFKRQDRDRFVMEKSDRSEHFDFARVV